MSASAFAAGVGGAFAFRGRGGRAYCTGEPVGSDHDAWPGHLHAPSRRPCRDSDSARRWANSVSGPYRALVWRERMAAILSFTSSFLPLSFFRPERYGSWKTVSGRFYRRQKHGTCPSQRTRPSTNAETQPVCSCSTWSGGRSRFRRLRAQTVPITNPTIDPTMPPPAADKNSRAPVSGSPVGDRHRHRNFQ